MRLWEPCPADSGYHRRLHGKASGYAPWNAGILSADSETYKLINTIGDGAFYFLPMLVAASAAKKFKTDMFLAISIAGVLIHPDFRSMMEAVTVGDTAAHFMGIPIASVKYTYTVIPSICMTWILSYIERGVDKITPVVNKELS